MGGMDALSRSYGLALNDGLRNRTASACSSWSRRTASTRSSWRRRTNRFWCLPMPLDRAPMRSLQALKTRKTSKAYLQEFALAGDSGALPSPEAWLSRLFFILSQHLIFLSLQRAELTFSVLPLAQVITP